nr:MAG TPA: hypothetical protein [Caudoviricetes sp.]
MELWGTEDKIHIEMSDRIERTFGLRYNGY